MSAQTKHLLIVGLFTVAVGIAALSYASRDHLDSALSLLTGPSEQKTVENLRAFAKLYGYVRYFHPSDAAANTDWEKFAIHGVRQVRDATSQAELKAELEALFEPIAPTVQLYRTGTEPPPPHRMLTPPDTSRLNLVAWQHKGLGLHSSGNPYYSIRINESTNSLGDTLASNEAGGRPFAWAIQNLDVKRFQKKQVRLRAAVRTAGPESQAHLYLLTPRGPSEPLSKPIASPSWAVHESTLWVPPNTTRLAVGAFLQDPGTAWFDNFELFARNSPRDPWERVDISYPSFESGQRGRSPFGWEVSSDPGSREALVPETPYDGQQSLKLELPSPLELKLFNAHPHPGEVVEKPLGQGLSAQVPLALYSRNEETLRPEGSPAPTRLKATLDSIAVSPAGDGRGVFAANVVIAWNVFQHFYPYFDVIDVDWDQVLTQSLRRSLTDTSTKEFLQTLRRLVAQLKDGHGHVHHDYDVDAPSENSGTQVPIRLARIGDRVVVDKASHASSEENKCPEIGDVVISAGGRPIEQKLQTAKRYISGSPQHKDVTALQEFGQGLDRSSIPLVLERDGKRVECLVRPSDVHTEDLATEPRPDPIETFDGGVHYVDLTRALGPD